jgi:subtilisin family serine protease
MDLRTALGLDLRALPERPLAPVAVSVVDSGIDATHPALRGRVAAAFRVEQGAERPLVVGASPDASNDVYGHGTAVAGIIAAVAPNARLTDVRVLDERNEATGEILVEGFRRAVESDARVINLSLACRARFAPQLHELCERAYRRNQIVVAAKRNMPLVDQGFPAELSACIAVDRERYPSPFEVGYRPTPPVEFVAHGVDVTAPAPGGGYRVVTGTSFATPAVTALCALLLGVAPELRPFEVKALLKGLAR